VAAVEFALVAPILLTMSLAVFDIARALLVWQQIGNAAEAIVEAAEKLSVTPQPDGSVTASLTPTQMQTAMTTIYAQVPGLNLGNPVGAIYPGSYSVTLSSVTFLPLCDPYPTKTKPACTVANVGTQRPKLVWSSYLANSSGNIVGGPSLNASPVPSPPLRPCGSDKLKPVAQFPNTVPEQYTRMIDPAIAPPNQPANAPMILVPQLVADVQYTFTPAFGAFSGILSKKLTFVASATLPAPVGQVNQEVIINPNSGALPANVVSCTD
jgi:Flp pilus assembly protein TadG